MGKAILFLVVVFVAAVGFMVYRGYTKATGTDPLAQTAGADAKKTSKSGEEGPGIFKRAEDIAGETVKKGAGAAKDALKTNLGLTVTPVPIDVAPGKKADAKIYRGAGDLPALNLTVEAAPGSGLKTSGGSFAAGQKEATFSVEAPADAKPQDTMVTLKYEDYALPVPVRIK
ncbi:MAG: hypothetical protein HY291_16510 [Planctomycetes bacterium]|nr:hypothetical protein [Planctomycetota bacterium]